MTGNKGKNGVHCFSIHTVYKFNYSVEKSSENGTIHF